jgi:DNA-binding beta-propeller fold protein YncE
MKRRTKRKIVLLVLLILLLAFLGLWYANYRATRSLALDLRIPDPDVLEAPVYLFSFSGSGAERLLEPIGVLCADGVVYVTDGHLGQVLVFREDGTFVRSFGKGTLQTPLYLAKNPKTGNLYVVDRRKRSVFIFKPSGQLVSMFDPKLPASEVPTFDTKGDQWVPVALDFAPDGSMYVLEYLNGHRMLTFAPNGKFVRSVGRAGVVARSDQLPGVFSFPNSVKVHKGEVYVADSNNRRIQVFDLKSQFKRFIAATGLPRGISFLPRPSSAASGTLDKFVVVDVLSHDGTIFAADGKRVVNFGERGLLDGQFNYPNDVSVGGASVIYITDMQNLRVQAWGWPEKVSPLPRVLPRQPAWCLGLLPLLLIPLLRRRKKFYATADFVRLMMDEELVHTMQRRRTRWFVSPDDYEELKDLSEGDIELSELLEPFEHSESDARALMSKLEIEHDLAATLAAAQRVKVLCTEDAEVRRVARLLEMDVVNKVEYLKRFARSRTSDNDKDPRANGDDDGADNDKDEGADTPDSEK